MSYTVKVNTNSSFPFSHEVHVDPSPVGGLNIHCSEAEERILSIFTPKSLMCSLVPSQVLPFPSQVVYNRVGKCGSRTVVLLLRILSEKHGFNLVTSDIHNKTRLTKNEQVSCLWPRLNCTLLRFICVIRGCFTGHPSNPDGWRPHLQFCPVYLSERGRKFKLSVLVVVVKPRSFRERILLLDQRTVCTHHCLFSSK